MGGSTVEPAATNLVALRRPCPICSASAHNVLYAQMFAPFGRKPDPWGYSLVACGRCGFVFADVVEKQQAIDSNYQLIGRPTERGYDLERLSRTADYIAANVNVNSRVLDAGCGTGALLTYLEKHGFRRMVGLDPTPAAIDRVCERGFDGFVGSLANPPALGTFDVIVLAHVLEHVRDLHPILAVVRTLLSPGGVVYAEVPDAARYADALYEPFHDINTEHINHFSLRSLALLFKSQGLTVVDSGEKWIECAPATPYPAVYGLWRLDSCEEISVEVTHDDAFVVAFEAYLTGSGQLLREVAARLEIGLQHFKEVALWGAGEFAQRLAWDTRFAGRRLVAVVDGSAQRQGLVFEGVSIGEPESLRDFPLIPIIVGSVLQSDEIVCAIRQGLHLVNPIISLYRPA